MRRVRFAAGVALVACIVLGTELSGSIEISKKTARFGICPSNITKVIVSEEMSGERKVARLHITLNEIGVQQLQTFSEKHLGESLNSPLTEQFSSGHRSRQYLQQVR